MWSARSASSGTGGRGTGACEVVRERRQGGVERAGAAPHGDDGAHGRPDQEEGRHDERERR